MKNSGYAKNNNLLNFDDNVCTKGRPFTVTDCYATLPNGKKYALINLLTHKSILCVIDVKHTSCDILLNYVCSLIGIQQTNLFGLSHKVYIDSGIEYRFMELFENVVATKHTPPWLNMRTRSFRALGQRSNLNQDCESNLRQPSLQLFLRVKYYVSNCEIKDLKALYYYALQMKENFVLNCQVWDEPKCYTIAAVALRLSNLLAKQHSLNKDLENAIQDVDIINHLPKWVIETRGLEFCRLQVAKIYQDYASMSETEACNAFIKMTSLHNGTDKVHDVAGHNLHFYKLYKKKRRKRLTFRSSNGYVPINKADNQFASFDTSHSESAIKSQRACDYLWLGISPQAIHFFEDNGILPKPHLSTLRWADIGKLSFEQEKFEIRHINHAREFVYYTGNDERSKYLLDLCKSTHKFSIAHKSLVKVSQLELRNKNKYSYLNKIKDQETLENLENTCLNDSKTTTCSATLNAIYKSLPNLNDRVDKVIVSEESSQPANSANDEDIMLTMVVNRNASNYHHPFENDPALPKVPASKNVSPIFNTYSSISSKVVNTKVQSESLPNPNTAIHHIEGLKPNKPPPSYSEAIELQRRNHENSANTENSSRKYDKNLGSQNGLGSNDIREGRTKLNYTSKNGRQQQHNRTDVEQLVSQNKQEKYKNPAACNRIKSFSTASHLPLRPSTISKSFSFFDLKNNPIYFGEEYNKLQNLLEEINVIKEEKGVTDLPPLMKALFKDTSLF